ncbi:MAG: TIGR02921 family PEP-CTERM protein [Microcoleus sp. PH2017_10_PVI_O_A]|uniref:TIGR02921 family PEP-CTERM protein n=1 Tax=unclassified Microcoleus TaxID=2642155 RepID=UPI001DE20916|nr:MULTISPECIES: TIGR02921 family PEP-CTERM protein [unclassified Microcoleus]TAE85420.1 MAG: TIGR02921 family PEP-CTERM protein [Oscillatoriales cyanobacterium]MCC3404724.1 TIGR02921 family PEP-CTERM protein [Microcoleus sp. PH2017_10_PVI_O_A]MCC3458745.1 TIGR02921 family PEP-CTERM protein [Microcoleus sp. PH2017_11_PCY_U_A]MCC3477500.1 TIGR02921 family PEP-CTERM protein [Microcoleus sp. PH2017_12_PCY_D_A]MCC3527194.1 TIGR02921 family PEP-CTERM protein [Microcoleus sp. PH2017_21_RUC_O_A]
MKKLKLAFNIIFQSIFWLWNLNFLSIVYLGILPYLAIPLIQATIDGIIPLEFSLTLTALIAVPTAFTILGFRRFRKQPLQLMRLFYGVEAPLFLLCSIRLFLLRELNPASSLIIATILLCIAAFLVEMLYGYLGKKENLQDFSTSQNAGNSKLSSIGFMGKKRSAWIQLGFHSLMLLVGTWAATLLMFYALPLAIVTIVGFFSFAWVSPLIDSLKYSSFSIIWWLPLSLILFGFTSSLFVVMPSLYGFLYIQSGRKVFRNFASQYGKNQAIMGSLGVMAAWLAIFAALLQQPQIQAMKMLATPAANDTARQTLLAKSDMIRSGLVNAYLSPYRYLSTVGENNHIYEIYKNTLSLPNAAARNVQNSYNFLMSPFLYQGSSSDVEKAEKLYAGFFDTEIQKGDMESVKHAVQSTSNREEAKAGLLNVNEEKVWLQSQEVTVTEKGDWADVQLYEVYKNQTPNLQEVFYYFSLPESAAVTGVWLGDTGDLNKRFVFTVSPRGAAQQVYNQQVRERVDPALLEQVGPKQYRLRAFPIPAKREFSGTPTDAPTEMNLWLTYKVMRQPQGWAMPVLAEKRNIYWDGNTRRTIAGKQVNYRGKEAKATWLPAFVPAVSQQQAIPRLTNLPGENTISAKPLVDANYSLPQGKKFAVILDTSRSMAGETKEVKENFEWLKANSLKANTVDLYVASAAGMPPKLVEDLRSFDAGKLTFYGTLQLKDILQQFAKLRGDKSYDTVFLVSDRHSYELSDDRKTTVSMPSPLWSVHLGGLPPGYDDATLKLIQDSGGGVATDIKEAMQRVATTAASGKSVVNVIDGYVWSYSKTPKAAAVPKITDDENEGFKPIAARQLITALSKQKTANQLTQLDAMHSLAKNFKVVTPYSSMIVLVNDAQREQLKAAEAKSDRFDREVESGKEQLTKPNNPLNVSGVPEPEEWLLLIVGAIGLLTIFLRQRRAKLID